MNFYFLTGFFEAIEQFLRQIGHNDTMQFSISTHEFVQLCLGDDKQRAVIQAPC
jgi:hypothetical protein